jgi:cytochrome oxidase assembly protein ShyY1
VDDREPTSMLRAAVRPRMLALLVLMLAAAAVCARLGVWQLDRAHVGAQADEPVAGQQTTAPLDDVLQPQTSFRGDLVARQVAVTGTFEADGQLLVTGRVVDGRPAYLVLTPLRVASAGGGDVAAAVLPVVRGWVASPDDAASLDVPAGEVEVTGYLQASEASGALDPSAATTDAISSAQLVNVWGGPIYSGYLALAGSDPAQPAGLTPLPPLVPDDGEGWDLRNLGYAAQWWIFGVFAAGLWVRLVRDEAHGEPRPGMGDVVPGAGDDDVVPGEAAVVMPGEVAVRGPAGGDAAP